MTLIPGSQRSADSQHSLTVVPCEKMNNVCIWAQETPKAWVLPASSASMLPTQPQALGGGVSRTLQPPRHCTQASVLTLFPQKHLSPQPCLITSCLYL